MAKESIETVVCKFNARKLTECGGIIRNRLVQKTGGEDFKKLELGFEVPANAFTIGGPQPNISDLAVIAKELNLQIRITSAELITTEQIETENGTAAAAKTAGK